MVVEKDKSISENESNPSNLLMRVCGGLTWQRLLHVSHAMKQNAMLQAGLMFALKCGAIAALVIMATWGFICFALLLPNPIRALTIWAYLILLAIAAQSINPSSRC